MKTIVKWSGGPSYVGMDVKENQVKISPKAAEEDAISPPDLLLMSLGSCKGIFFLPAVKELGLDVKDFEITLEGEKSKNPPKLFEKINIYFKVWGDVTKEDVKRAIKKSDEKCFIAYSLNPDIETETFTQIEK